MCSGGVVVEGGVVVGFGVVGTIVVAGAVVGVVVGFGVVGTGVVVGGDVGGGRVVGDKGVVGASFWWGILMHVPTTIMIANKVTKDLFFILKSSFKIFLLVFLAFFEKLYLQFPQNKESSLFGEPQFGQCLIFS